MVKYNIFIYYNNARSTNNVAKFTVSLRATTDYQNNEPLTRCMLQANLDTPSLTYSILDYVAFTKL